MSPNKQSDSRIKELGRKARERLEAENQKRPEVVCLDTSALPKPPPPPSQAPSNHRKRQSTKNTDGDKTDANVKAVNAPNIPTATSSIVCLQGFPDDVATTGHVKRFLSGIDALIVYVPLFKIRIESNNETWEDIKHEKKRKRRSTVMATDDGAVLVRLASPSIATLAVARSGEPAVGIGDSDDSQKEKIKIVVSEVPSNVFEKLQSLLITGWKSVTFGDIRSTVLAALHPAVEPILRHYYHGFLQTRERNISRSIENIETVSIPGLRKGDLDEAQPCDKTSEERIQNLRDEIQYQLPFLDFENDPDPVAYLSREAVLLLETRRLEPLRSDRIRQFRLAYL
eukprot:scaffold581_cov169-Amphora_coffeaeformis.AAC.4